MITASLKLVPVGKSLRQLESDINDGAYVGIGQVALTSVKLSQDILQNKVVSGGGKWTGNLANAILTKPGLKQKGIARWDIVVDTKRAPYADWIENGKYAVALPYGNTSGTGKRDYSKSSFKGHHYLQEAATKLTESDFATKIVVAAIDRHLSGNNAVV